MSGPTGMSTAPRYSASDSAKLPIVVILYLIFVITPVEFKLGTVSLTPLRMLLLILVIPLTGRLFSGQFGKAMAVDYLFFIHMAWATLAVAVNNPNRVVENVGSAAVEFLGGYLIARAYIRTPDQFEALIKALMVIVFALLPFTLPESFGGRAVIPHIVESVGLGTVKQVDIPKRMGLYRVQNVFAHPIHYGLFCSVTFSLVLLGLHERMSLAKRLLGCAAIMIAVFLSLSSGALLAVILQSFLLAWAFIFRKSKQKWLLLLGMIVLGYVTIDLLSNRTPTKVFMSYATFSSQTAYYRSIIFDYGMQNVWANPIFGLGLRTWFRPAYMKSGSVDNYWLVMAMKYGIPGFTLVTLGYFWGLFKVGLTNVDFSTRVWRLRLAWMITFCGLSFTMTTVHVWTAIYSFVFFFYGSGIWIIYYKPEDEGATVAAENASKVDPRKMVYQRDHRQPEVERAAGGPVYSRHHAEPQPRQEASPPRADAPRYTRFARAKGPDTGPKRKRDD
jgi:O-antigen ligase